MTIIYIYIYIYIYILYHCCQSLEAAYFSCNEGKNIALRYANIMWLSNNYCADVE